ncbi:hypothetical protein RHSP_17631 [Rhizobium freirei PRF 81]|uniref:Transmembrane protein n=1 Tax=Rhizobium freirei PRF 81 TaxID=363754 RepID=N6V4A3_9HYPH|nr:hypothetical protein RHSP_17631 [Rhizobium freirei PRF 81]
MTAIELPPSGVAQPQLITMRLIGTACVTIGVFLSGFVIAEPAPYEVWLALLIGIWFIIGLKISRGVAPLLVLFLAFNIGGMLSIAQMRALKAGDHLDGPIYIAVSTFLALSSVFYAAIVEDSERRLKLIFNTWVVAALITASLGIFGHVGIGNVIDTDHWRHFYILIGIVWGCGALEQKYQRSLSGREAAP